MDEEPQIHIASAVVRFQAAVADTVWDEFQKLSSLQLIAFDGAGKAVIVIEAEHRQEVAEILNTLPRIPGVLNVALVAYVTERRSVLAEEIL